MAKAETQTKASKSMLAKAADVVKNALKTPRGRVLPNAAVRYDASRNLWGVVPGGRDGTIKEHFERGYIKDAVFSTVVVKKSIGCGSVHSTHVGFATGELHIGTHPKVKQSELKHLSFDGAHFIDAQTGAGLFSATVILLTPGRKALYKEAK